LWHDLQQKAKISVYTFKKEKGFFNQLGGTTIKTGLSEIQ